MNPKSNLKIVSIHSHKGGVGKTSIALGTAIILTCDYNKRVLLIDADFSGASIADAIDEFSIVPIVNGLGKIDKKSISRRALKIYIENRTKYYSADLPDYNADLPYFLNDYIMEFVDFSKKEKVKDFLWEWEIDYKPKKIKKKMQAFPSSSHIEDIREMSRLCDSNYAEFVISGINDCIKHIEVDFDVIIIDTSPGLHSLSIALACENFAIKNERNRQRWVVTTPDPADFISSYNTRDLCKVSNSNPLKHLHDIFVLNRTAGDDETRNVVKTLYEHFDFSISGLSKEEIIERYTKTIFDQIKHVPEFSQSRLIKEPHDKEQTFLVDIDTIVKKQIL